MFFKLKHSAQKGSARIGVLNLQHAKVETPFFMPTETKGIAKFVSQEELEKMGCQCFISNALLLYFQPGPETIAKAKGLHKFVNWDKGIFTDSGGFQVIDPTFLQSISDKAAVFKDPFSGQKHRLTPEKVIEIQNSLAADAIMCLDHQPVFPSAKPEIAKALQRTLLWAERCKNSHSNPKQLLFGISQGGLFKDLRVKGLRKLLALGFEGIAIGGFGIGEQMQKTLKIVKACRKQLPAEIPIHLMGIGSPLEMLEAISFGIDAFDSCFPTRVGRHGYLFTSKGKIHILKKQFANNLNPIDKECDCFACKNYSRAFLHHLLKMKEPTGLRLSSHHNLHFVFNLFKQARLAIKEENFEKFKKEFMKNYKARIIK